MSLGLPKLKIQPNGIDLVHFIGVALLIGQKSF